MKKFLFVFLCFIFVLAPVFAADNMHISVRDDGEIISGFKVAGSTQEIKINILYPADFKTIDRTPLVLILDTKEYRIENLRQMFYGDNDTNPQALIAAFNFKNANLTQENFDAFLEEVFAFFEINYKGESEPSKKIILAKNNFALFALNSLNKEANYFSNLGIILDNTTALPILNTNTKKQPRLFALSQKANIISLQNIFVAAGLKPMVNFFFQINDKPTFEQFDLRYFLNSLPEIKKIKPVLPKEIAQEVPFYLQVLTTYSTLDFMPTQIKFAPPVLAYDDDTAHLKVLLPEAKKVKISGVFAGKKWAQKVKISK